MRDSFDVLPNVWLGTSVEDGRVIHRLDELRDVPAAVRFVSFEPLIGSVFDGSLNGIQWAIVGGESGPKARPMDPAWIDEIFDQGIQELDKQKRKEIYREWVRIAHEQQPFIYLTVAEQVAALRNRFGNIFPGEVGGLLHNEDEVFVKTSASSR